VPADFGPPELVANAFMPPGTGLSVGPAMPAMMQRPGIGAPRMDPAVVHLQVMLRDGPLPSHREMAAEQLACCDWRNQPAIVESLVASAKGDPAATVRAGCVRVLGQMKVCTPEVLATVQSLKNDRDERVRQEVARVLPAFGADMPPAGDSTVRQVGAKQVAP
jgi:hypothetical protein